MSGVISTEGIDEFTASRAALRKQFLEITQRNPSSCRRCARIRSRSAKPSWMMPRTRMNSLSDTRRRRIARCKQRADKIIDCEPHVAIGTRGVILLPRHCRSDQGEGARRPFLCAGRGHRAVRIRDAKPGTGAAKKSAVFHNSPALLAKRSRPGDIHEHDIAHIEAHGFFVDIAPAHSSAVRRQADARPEELALVLRDLARFNGAMPAADIDEGQRFFLPCVLVARRNQSITGQCAVSATVVSATAVSTTVVSRAVALVEGSMLMAATMNTAIVIRTTTRVFERG